MTVWHILMLVSLSMTAGAFLMAVLIGGTGYDK